MTNWKNGGQQGYWTLMLNDMEYDQQFATYDDAADELNNIGDAFSDTDSIIIIFVKV